MTRGGDEVHYIRPIEFGGVTYRSLTEARWAWFFTAAKVPFEYEQHAYDLGTYRYVPDFFLTRGNVFFEVKPTVPTEREENKAKALAFKARKGVIIACGAPSFDVSLLGYSHKSRGRTMFLQQEHGGEGVALVGCWNTLEPCVRLSACESEEPIHSGSRYCPALMRAGEMEFRNGKFVSPSQEMSELLRLRRQSLPTRFERDRRNHLERVYRWRIDEYEEKVRKYNRRRPESYRSDFL
jgi:hypothetical protein